MTADTSRPEPPFFNIASRLIEQAARTPFRRAVVASVGKDPKGLTAYTHLTFQQLDRASDRLAHGFASIGIGQGSRSVLMTPPSIDFFIVTFALFKTGAIPVVVDPGMGVERMVECLRHSSPEAFIGIPKAHLMRKIYPTYFKSVKTYVTVGKRWAWGGHTLDRLMSRDWLPFQIADTTPSDPAAILFTTGSTGPPKGTVYTHANFDAQIKAIREHFHITSEDIDLPTFPLFSLFDPALGMTAVIPDMDPTKPAQAEPGKLIEAITDQGVTTMFASPALLRVLARHGSDHNIQLSSIRRVVSAGAPVSSGVISELARMLPPDATIHTPYGATEAMPVSSIDGNEILNDTEKFTNVGYGVCVGKPLDGIEAKIIPITDDPIDMWSEDLEVPDGEIGEITVTGAVVTASYFDNPIEDRKGKISHDGQVRHRMGDLGWKDQKGRIWFCGRKSHRVRTETADLYTIPCEAIFNNHPDVYRSALVGVGEPGRENPVICIELEPECKDPDTGKIVQDLLAMAEEHPLTQSIKTILFHPGFPTDIRHNAKIFREALAIWAREELGR